MNVPAMMCSASTALGWLASLSAVAASGPFDALQTAFALATNAVLLSVGVAGEAVVVAAALLLVVVLLVLLPPHPAAASTSAALAIASAIAREKSANLTFMVLLISSGASRSGRVARRDSW